MHILTCHAVVPPTTTDGTVILHHTHAITAEAKLISYLYMYTKIVRLII
jgi:hypothetical protein